VGPLAAPLGQCASSTQEVADGEIDREDYLARFAQQWRDLEPDEFPFVHHVVDEFEGHDDTEQFRAGLDLLLAGLRLQAGR